MASMMGYSARAQLIGTRLRHSCSISSSPRIKHSRHLSSLSNRHIGFPKTFQTRPGFSSTPVSTTRCQPLARIESATLAPPVLLFSSLQRRASSRAGPVFNSSSKVRYASTASSPERVDGKDEKRYVANLPKSEPVLCFLSSGSFLLLWKSEPIPSLSLWQEFLSHRYRISSQSPSMNRY